MKIHIKIELRDFSVFYEGDTYNYLRDTDTVNLLIQRGGAWGKSYSSAFELLLGVTKLLGQSCAVGYRSSSNCGERFFFNKWGELGVLLVLLKIIYIIVSHFNWISVDSTIGNNLNAINTMPTTSHKSFQCDRSWINLCLLTQFIFSISP